MTRSGAQAAADIVESTPLTRDITLGWFCLLYFLLNFSQGAFAPLLPQIMDGLGLTFAAAGLLGTAFGSARFVTDVPAGVLVERTGIAVVLHAGIGCLLLGTGLSAWAPSLAAMLLARGLVGMGSGMCIVVSVLFLLRRGPAAQRTRRANLYEVGVISGMSTGAWLAGDVAARFGWRWGLGTATFAIALGWLIATFLVLPAASDLRVQAPRLPASRDRLVVRSWAPIVAIYLSTFSLAVAWAGGVSTLLPLYGGRGLSLPPEVLGRTIALAYAVGACLFVPVGWAADVLGRVRVMVPGFAVVLVGMLLVPHTRSALALGLAATLLIAGMTVWMTLPVLLAEQLPGGFRGPAAGFYRFISDLAYILAPGAVGWLIDRRGFGMAAAVMAIVLAVAIAVSLAILREPRSVTRTEGP
jgi:YNFM family putative membrane transporter